MKKQILPVLSLIIVALLFSACPKNSKLAQSKQKKTPAKQEGKTAVNPERIKEKLSEEIAEMRERREAHEKYDQPREAAEFYKLKRVPVGEKEIPVEKYLLAKEQMREMRQYSSAENRFLPSRAEMERSPQREANLEALGNWTSLGPGNIGGRTRALIIHPTGANVMYAGGVAGGVWKTTNGGTNWTPVGDLLPNIAVSALAFDPANPEIIFAGTGEGYYNGDGLRGAGIFKSVNGGVSWTRIASTDTPDFYYVNDIIVSHNNSNNMYVATKSGVWRSVNGGASWENVLVASGGLGCTDLVIRKDKSTDYLFAASSNGGTSAAKIFRNDNASAVAGIWTNVYSESGMDRAAIAISPSNPNVVYAVASTSVRGIYQYGLHAVWRSTSSGDSGTWTTQVSNSDAVKLNTLLFTNPLAATYAECNFAPNNFYSQGDYDMAIAIDPTDENRVWVGGIDLFRSDDGGRNWGLASYWWAEPTDPSYSHADNHIIVFHPNYNGGTNKKMFVGSDGGISRTDDARANLAVGEQATCNPANTSVRWTSLNNNYGVTQFYHGAVFPDGKSYFGGTQDNGTLLGSDTAGINGWKEIYGGDGGYVAIDPTNPNILYSSTPGGNFRKSTDGGKTWGDATFGISDTSLFIAPLAMDPSDPQRMWTGGRKLWRTENGGANWKEMSSFSAPISAIALSSSDSSAILVGFPNGLVSAGYQAINNPSFQTYLPRNGFVSGLAIDPRNRYTTYVTYSTFGGSHVWKSDGGSTYTAIDGTGANKLPDVPVHCLVIDPANSSRLFVGTDLGVFVTTDSGQNWSVENTGFSNAPVEWLTINNTNGEIGLYAFSHGRGVWRVSLGSTNCSYSLSEMSQNFEASGGTGSVKVSSNSGCAWTAETQYGGLLTIIGKTNDTVTYRVAPNTSALAQSGTISIAGKSFLVYQKGTGIIPPQLFVTFEAPSNKAVYRTMRDAIDVVANVGGGDIATWRHDRGGNTENIIQPRIGNGAFFTVKLAKGRNKITIKAASTQGAKLESTLIVDSYPTYVPTAIAGAGSQIGDGVSANLAKFKSLKGLFVDDLGNIYLADAQDHRIRKIDQNGIIQTIAGTGTQGFSGDGGAAATALLNSPGEITFDKTGNLYFADNGNHRIRKISPTGIISTVIGNGQRAIEFAADSVIGEGVTPLQVTLLGVPSITLDNIGNIIFTDNYRIRRLTISDGLVRTIAGNGRNGDPSGNSGKATSATMLRVSDAKLDIAGNIYTAEGAFLRKINQQGIIDLFASNGSLFNFRTSACNVEDVTKDALNNCLYTDKLYIDSDNRIYTMGGGAIWRIYQDRSFETLFGGSERATRGNPDVRPDYYPIKHFTISKSGVIYFISENKLFKLSQIITENNSPVIEFISPTNGTTWTTSLSPFELQCSISDDTGIAHVSLSSDSGAEIIQSNPSDWNFKNISLRLGVNNISITAWDTSGNSNTKILSVTYAPPNNLTTVAGAGMQGFNLESGSSLSSQLYAPETVAVDNSGNIFIADKGNHRIRKVTRSGVISTVAGNGQIGSSGDGGLAVNAPLNSPNGVAVDNSGNIYIADTNNQRIRKVNSLGILSTIAGSGIQGFDGDGSANPALQQLDTPVGIFLDAAGNLLIADAGNHRIRKLNLTSGVLTTIAGKGYGSGTPDGAAALNTFLRYPTSVVADISGNIYISNTSGHNIKKVNSAGILTNYAGNGTAGFGGDGADAKLAQLDSPGGIALDGAGNLFVTDQRNNCLRKIDGSGVITTPAGRGANSNLKDPVIALMDATLNAPAGVVVDRAGNIIIADTNNHRVVMISAFKNVASVNGASFSAALPVAAESIASAFGNNLAIGSQAATSLPLPTELSGTTVKVRDSAGIERLAPLFYAGAGQVNYQIPAGTAAGFATIIVTNSNGEISTGAVNVVTTQPGIFSATSDGAGAAAATLLFIKNGLRTGGVVAPCTAQGCTAIPIDLNASDETFLEMYGTGIRANSGVGNVTVTIGGVTVPVLYAGAHCCFVGVDQINLSLPKSLVGKGLVDVVLTVDGKIANAVKINLK